MRITIDGYRNIEKLDYELIEKKINLLFGVSGSGKSSIAMAVSNNDFNFNKKVNYSGETRVLINDLDVNSENVLLYDTSSVDKYFVLNEENDVVFDILIDDQNDLKSLQDNFEEFVNQFKSKVLKYQNEYTQLKEIYYQ